MLVYLQNWSQKGNHDKVFELRQFFQLEMNLWLFENTNEMINLNKDRKYVLTSWAH